ncbi:MAG: translesion DNA synthesis-associated protein ImuA [Casimicrobiaceae bacterium]
MSTETPSPASAALDKLVWRYGKTLPAIGQSGMATGFAELDRALPQHGWFADGLNELLGNEQGAGEFSLLLPSLRQVCTAGQGVVLVNPPFLPYAPALAEAGIAVAHLIVVRHADIGQLYWAAEQALRSKACGAVVIWSDESARRLPDLLLRRLQIAAHSGACAGFLFRPRRAREHPSPAPLRIVYAPVAGQLELTVHKCRGLSGTPRVRVQPWRYGWAARPLPKPAPAPGADFPLPNLPAHTNGDDHVVDCPAPSRSFAAVRDAWPAAAIARRHHRNRRQSHADP